MLHKQGFVLSSLTVTAMNFRVASNTVRSFTKVYRHAVLQLIPFGMHHSWCMRGAVEL